MTDTNVADAVAYALDDGIKSVSDGAELMNSAGYLNALATHIHGAYIPDGSLPFTTVDTSNNLLDVGPGRAFITVSGVEVQSDRSGAIDPGYDTTLPADVVVGISLPSEVTDLGLDAGENDVWVAIDADGSTGAAGDVYLRHGSGLSAPGDPSVQVGTVDADSGDTTRANDRAAPALADAAFPDIAGSPRFSTHDHSKAGLSAVPNAGLANDSITRSAGDGVTYSSGSAGTVLGGSATLAVDLASTAGLKVAGGALAVEPADFAGALLKDDGSDALAVDEPSIDHDNIDQLTVTADDHHPRIQVSDSGAAVVTQPTDVNFASSLDVTDDGDGTITVDVALDTMEFNTDESGAVTAGNSGMVYTHGLPDGDTLAVLRAGLLLADGQPAPTGLDLILATLDGAGGGTKQTTIISGDGSVQATVEGDPLTSYENTSGGEETVAVLVDNGNYNAGTGADQDIVADAHGEVV